jgi:hypothetical protein
MMFIIEDLLLDRYLHYQIIGRITDFYILTNLFIF